MVPCMEDAACGLERGLEMGGECTFRMGLEVCGRVDVLESGEEDWGIGWECNFCMGLEACGRADVLERGEDDLGL